MSELALTFARNDRTETLVTAAVWLVAGALLLFFVVMLVQMVGDGVRALSWEFVFGEARESGRAGGIGAVLVSTFLVVGMAIAIAFPLSTGAALYLVEYMDPGSRRARLLTGSLDVLAAVPSVVFGLFGNALFCELLGLGYSLAAGALTLVCVVMPVMVKAAADGLTAVPWEQRAAGSALALSKTALIWHVVLPSALPGIVSGVLLGVARSLAETAALLFTSGYVLRMPESLLDSGRTVSIHIYDLAMNVAGGDLAAYGSATVLVVLLLVVNATIVGIGRYAQRRTAAVS